VSPAFLLWAILSLQMQAARLGSDLRRKNGIDSHQCVVAKALAAFVIVVGREGR
jgi:hypothetical protein